MIHSIKSIFIKVRISSMIEFFLIISFFLASTYQQSFVDHESVEIQASVLQNKVALQLSPSYSIQGGYIH